MSEHERDHDHIEPLGGPIRRVVDEVRGETPSVDWDRLEAKLFDEEGRVRDDDVRASPEAPAPRRGRATTVAAAFAALAIAASFVFAIVTPKTEAPTGGGNGEVATARPKLVIDGSGRTLAVGDEVAAADAPLVIRAAGRVVVHLPAGSKARLLDDGERIRFALDVGSIAAEVVPVPGGEPFAVDVDARRVAVHGTKLVVTRVVGELSVVQVAVSEGSAVVGPSHGDGRTEGPVVAAGSVGTFGSSQTIVADPAEAARLVGDGIASPAATTAMLEKAAPPPNVVETPAPAATLAPSPNAPNAIGTTNKAAPLATAPTVAIAPAVTATVAPPPPPAPGLSDAQVSPTMSTIVGAVKACVPRTASGVTYSTETTMTLSIAPSGVATCNGGSFSDSPLDTKLWGCICGVVAQHTFPTALGPTTVSRHVVLGVK